MRSWRWRAVVVGLVGMVLAGGVALPAVAQTASVSVSVQRWVVEDLKGTVSHRLVVEGTPCTKTCSWSVRAWHVGSGGTKDQKSLGGGNLYPYAANNTSFSFTLADEDKPRAEITHVEARLFQGSGNLVATSGLVAVGGAMPPATIDLSVSSFERDPATGAAATYLYLDGFGLGGVGDPCEIGVAGCSWKVESGSFVDGQFVRHRLLASGNSPSGTSGMWYLSKYLNWSGVAPGVTHLRAQVTSVLTGREVLDDVTEVSDFVAGDFQLHSFVAPTTALIASRGTELCDPLLFSPLNSDLDSPPDAWKACEQALLAHAAAPAVLNAVVTAAGLSAVQLLMDGDGPIMPSYVAPRTKFPFDPDADDPPEPEPAAAGGIVPPPNCLDGEQRDHYLGSLPEQSHHLASDKHSLWTPLFNKVLSRYYLDLDGPWNLSTIDHRFSHAPEYHEWVLRNLEQADLEAGGDVQEFLRLFDQYVRQVVEGDPSIVNWRYWWCYR